MQLGFLLANRKRAGDWQFCRAKGLLFNRGQQDPSAASCRQNDTVVLSFSLLGRVAAAPEHVGCHIVFPRDIGLFVRRAEPFIYKQNASFRVL